MNKKDRRNAGLADTCMECARRRSRDNTITKNKGLVKRCRKCGARGPFYKNKSNTDGHDSMCISCRRAVVRKWSTSEHGMEVIDLYRSSGRRDRTLDRYRRGPAGRKRQADTMAKHRMKHPDRAKARGIIMTAVRNGKIYKPTRCSVNNDRCAGQIEGHHEDYSDPLDVVWLCRFHHLEIHRIKRDADYGISAEEIRSIDWPR